MDKNSFRLVDATEEHLDLIYNWRNKPSIREMMYNSDLIDWETHIKWFQDVQKDNKKYVKILYYKDEPYGLANFQIIDTDANVGKWGFYIGEEQATKGMGTVLAYKILEFLFEELNIRKVCAEVIDYNQVSLNFHKKVGFVLEGDLRKHIQKDGCYRDVYLFSIFKDEWLNKKVQLEVVFT